MSSSKKKYSEFLNKRSQTNIWNHFLRADDGQTAICKICKKILKTGGGSTSGLHVHLRKVHSNALALVDAAGGDVVDVDVTMNAAYKDTAIPGTSKEQLPEPNSKKRKHHKITDYFKSDDEDNLNIIISRMAALHGASFRFLCECEDLRRLFKKSGYDELPKSRNTISNIIRTQAEEVKKQIKIEILEIKTAGHRFSITLDEWTSLRNKRYMNINIHSRCLTGSNYRNLGLVKITGSMPASAAIKMLEDHLEKFNVSLQDDIVSITTDGASVMVKMGSFFEGHHQLCLAHCIQLAVIDVLYKATLELNLVRAAVAFDSVQDDNTSDSSDSDSEREDCFKIENPSRQQVQPILFKGLIEKVRRLVKSVRKSPLKADTLRAYVNQEFGHNIELVLDCQTRWSSLSDMIGTFLKLKDCLFKALIDWKSDISFSEQEIKSLTEIHQSLNTIKVAVATLCRRDATLLTADTALRFTLKKLDEQNNLLASKLATSLRNRLKQRRQLIAGVLHYLHDPEEFFNQSEDDTFTKPNSQQIAETVVALLTRLRFDEPASVDSNTSRTMSISTRHTQATQPEIPSSSNDADRSQSQPTLPPQLSIQEELDEEIKMKCKDRSAESASSANFDLEGFVQVEQAMYDNGGKRGYYLTKAYNYLLAVLPTSVESERVFSAAGYFCNKLRSSLSDQTLSALLLLRSHFQEKNKQL